MQKELLSLSYCIAHSISHVQTDHFLIHTHSFYELYYFVSGDVHFLYDGIEYQLNPHTLIIIAPDIYHGMHVRSADAYERFTVHFTSDIIAPERRSVLMGCLPTARTLRTPGLSLPFLIENAQSLNLIPLLLEYERLLDAPEPVRETMISVLTESLLAILRMRRNTAPAALRVSPYTQESGELRPILDYIHQNLTGKLTLDDLCTRFFISKTKLNNLFRSQMGTTAIDYVIRRRVLYARQLLLNGVTATQAAAAAGFGDYTVFYRAYIKQTGHSPREERSPVSGKPRSIEDLHLLSDEDEPADLRPARSIWEAHQYTPTGEMDPALLRDPGEG